MDNQQLYWYKIGNEEYSVPFGDERAKRVIIRSTKKITAPEGFVLTSEDSFTGNFYYYGPLDKFPAHLKCNP